MIRRLVIKRVVKRLAAILKGQSRRPKVELPANAKLVPRDQHNISRNNISDNALKVLYRLKNSNYQAYLVGGGVRDLLLGREPKDFDVATDAKPEQVRKCFRNGRLIGRRFRLVHVLFKNEIIEVTTFRAQLNGDADDEELQTEHGMLLADNVYGTFAEDAARRDFTINALYYNIADFSVIDCHDGINDLRQGLLRVIGDPEARYREDPVRMLRAIRLAAKLGFRIEEKSEQPILHMGHLLTNISSARLLTEVEKLFMSGTAEQGCQLLRHYRVFKYLFPLTEQILGHEQYEIGTHLLSFALADMDRRIAEEKPVSVSFIFAAFLWYPLQKEITDLLADGHNISEALHHGMNEVLVAQNQHVALPRRLTIIIRDIWLLQERFKRRQRNRVYKVLHHKRIRAALDFMALRVRAGEDIAEMYEWWQQIYNVDEVARTEMIKELHKRPQKKSRSKRKPRKKEAN